ncbi:probable RNA-directed DNA polymerase from transposon BS [Trichonephila clavipes]|uniref:Probable RNA-directed DNA polymerase from transposon BS n=1 Tax=Trichonephila clavipes TaxID=2585209 RepID=A0A8X6WL58_TRICX|nr:probable RNA-directed DNA polymerase from transposon BS [Trichonephila clavipes]
MSFSSSLEHAASLVTQNNQECAEGLGRGPSSKNLQRSPAKYRSLKIIHCNINGISIYASRIKLDAILDIAESLEVQIIALQETKLKEHAKLKIKGYNIIRSDRQEGGGGGLAFLVRDINYRTIDNPQFTDSKLEIQRLNVIWKGKNLNISNMYHPPNQKSLPDNLLDISESNLLVGDLNAKHSSWGSVINNKRGVELHNLMDDSAHLALNDGSPTYSSHSYHTEEALDVSIVSSDIFPFCKWTVLQDIGSDHLPILVELKWKQLTQLVKKNFWNFKKANWEKYRDTVDRGLLSKPPFKCRSIDDLDESWLSFKKIIFKAAGQAIPRGNYKRPSPFFMHKSPLLQPLLKKRVDICREIKKSNNPSLRSSLNKINAEIKRTFIHLKREKWKELCKSIDTHTPNTKLWKLMKSLNITQPQQEECNTIIDDNGQISSDNKTSANLLGSYYQKTSKLNFNAMDKDTENYARKLVHGCRSSEHGIPIFKEFFTMQELNMALSNFDPSKSPGPDNIHGQMISRLSDWGKKSLLEIFNLSWRLGRLPRDWKKALIIPIRKSSKKACYPESFRPIALTNFSCKLMEKIILERLTYYLNSNDLLSIEQYGFKRGHSTADQILYFGQRVRDSQNLRPSHHTVAVFLDLSKAFDRVWRNKLIIKAFQHLWH